MKRRIQINKYNKKLTSSLESSSIFDSLETTESSFVVKVSFSPKIFLPNEIIYKNMRENYKPML
jgi:hypothetical protein